MKTAGDLAEQLLGQIPQFTSWPRRRPSMTTGRERGERGGQTLAVNSIFPRNTIRLMFAVDGRLRGQDVIWEFWTSQKPGPEFLHVENPLLSTIALPSKALDEEAILGRSTQELSAKCHCMPPKGLSKTAVAE